MNNALLKFNSELMETTKKSLESTMIVNQELNNMSSSNDLEQNAKELQSIGQEERGKQMGELWQEIEQLMRDEIGYYKK